MDVAHQPPIALAERTERLCASLLRRQNTIVGGGMQVMTTLSLPPSINQTVDTSNEQHGLR